MVGGFADVDSDNIIDSGLCYVYDIIFLDLWYHCFESMISRTYDIIDLWYHRQYHRFWTMTRISFMISWSWFYDIIIWNLAKTWYRDMMSLYWYIPILNPISGTILQTPYIRTCPDIRYPDIGTNIWIYQYRDQMSRYRVIEFPNIAHYVSCFQQAPGPGLRMAFRLLPPARNR